MTENNKTKNVSNRFIIIMSSVAAFIIALTVALNCLAFSVFDLYLTQLMGSTDPTATPASSKLDVEYNKSEFKTQNELSAAKKELSVEIAGEGIVLLENKNCLPLPAGTELSFFGHSSVDMVYGGKSSQSVSLKDAFTSEGFVVNETLWQFYESGAGSGYKRGNGYGLMNTDWSINECPLSALTSTSGLESSFEGTIPVFVLSRIGGEGNDLPRGMYDYARTNTDKAKHYLEPDITELEIINYLDRNFDEVIIVVNAANAMELGWVENYPNIKAVVSVPPPGPDGLTALAGIFSGKITPSGRLTDTYVYDNFSAPATENTGDFRFTSGGGVTNYHYVTYNEGIYVGYRYYETRYEDVVLGSAGAGNFNYADTVKYPFGYGLSYASFEWSDMSMSKSDSDGNLTVSIKVKNVSDVFAGKDVVQVYFSSPYTEYDRANGVEKPSVELCGYAKTSLLVPGEEETIVIKFNVEEFKAYNENYGNGAGGYIVDAGRYYVTAAQNAHVAVNNVLAAKYSYGESVDPGKMSGAGSASFVKVRSNIGGTDETTYAVDEAGNTPVANKFAHASLGGVEYLSRGDWTGTYPFPYGAVSSVKSEYGERANGSDGYTGYRYTREATAATLLRMRSIDSLSPVSDNEFTQRPVSDAKNGTELIDLRGAAYYDEKWEALLSNIAITSYNQLISKAERNTAEIKEIKKPAAKDDGTPAGITTVFPCETMIACTWNDALARRMGELAGEDGLAAGKSGWYAPSVNIHRTPFGGRNFECYGEDGLLSGQMGAATVKGAAAKGVYAFVRYFALCEQETHRGDRGLATYANEQTIREVYLKPFEIVVKSGTRKIFYYERHEEADGTETFVRRETDVPAATAVMTSSNRIGETWAGGNYNLITGVLRGEWGFKGFVLTDTEIGDYMPTAQMLRAGGDGKFSQLGMYTEAERNAADAHYVRIAAKNILYCVVNSSLMNGFVHGVEYVPGFPFYALVVMAFDLLAVGGLIAIAVVIVVKLRLRKKVVA